MDTAELAAWARSERDAARRRKLDAVDCPGTDHRYAVGWEEGYAKALDEVLDRVDVVIDLREGSPPPPAAPGTLGARLLGQ